jgi:formylglycine-generating enzyme required for sulfatase activity
VWNDLFGVFAEAHPEAVVDSSWTKGAQVGRTSLGVTGAQSKLPVLNVRLAEAVRFASWLGGRLPTADEWDKAAGLNDQPAGAAGPFVMPKNLDDLDVAVGREAEGPIPVGSSKDDVSVFGMRDAAGNGWEFTSSDFVNAALPPVEEFERDLTLQVMRRGHSFGETNPLTFEAMREPQFNLPTPHHWTSFRVVFEEPEQ